MCEIKVIERSLHKGDGITSKDTKFRTLKLKDGSPVAVTFFPYGEDAEEEILETIKNSIV